MSRIENKNILIGITGGIAAYKITELIRMYKRDGANVAVVVTSHAMDFVTPMTLQTLSQMPIVTDDFHWKDFKPEHIALTEWADIFVVAPVTANTLGKFASGICDNILTSTFCAFRKPIILAPSMNTGMWESPIVQENVKKLEKHCEVLEPEDGFLACGTSGRGRLCNLDKIFDKTVEILSVKKKLVNKKIIITSGGTVEKIDPVRYISNFSSGKMGNSLADIAYSQGAEVILITTKAIEKPYKTIIVKSADEMKEKIEEEFKTSDCLIMAAAVADYKVKNYSDKKIKKTKNNDEIAINLVKNIDILKYFSEKRINQKVVGFAAESDNLLEYAKEKIVQKGCDYIIANDISKKDIGFGADENEVYIIDRNMKIKHINKASKQEVAFKIFEEIYE